MTAVTGCNTNATESVTEDNLGVGRSHDVQLSMQAAWHHVLCILFPHMSLPTVHVGGVYTMEHKTRW